MLYIPSSPTPTSPFYSVKINGQECPVRPIRVSAMPFNRGWPGHQRPLDQTEIAYFVTFSADEAVNLEVSTLKSFKKVFLRPLSKEVGVKVDKTKTMRFTLTENGSYVLETDDEHACLHIFFNKASTEEVKPEDVTYYYGAGAHDVGMLTLKSGESVYIAPDAVLFGGICAEGADHIRVFGGGIIDNSKLERPNEECYIKFCSCCVRFFSSHDIQIEDVILVDSAIWNLSLFDCSDVTVRGVKIVGQWRYNSDGIDIVNTQNVLVENCFVRVFDDVVTIKGVYGFEEKPVENLLIQNCVFWCDWGRTCEVGIETAAPYYKNIVFRDCDLVHSSNAAIDIRNGYSATITDVVFENINIEYAATWKPEIYEITPEEEHLRKEAPDMLFFPTFTPGDRIGVADFFFTDNFTFWAEREKCARPGDTHHVVCRNIRFYMDKKCPKPRMHFKCFTDKGDISDFLFEDIYMNGKKVKNYEKAFKIEMDEKVTDVVMK